MPGTYACVSFANAIPYVEGLLRLPAERRPRLLLEAPNQCADRLREGGADAALVPSVEFFGIPGAVRAGRFGIASRREVRSVVLLSREEIGAAGRIAVDANSRTSVALLRILLARKHGARPELVPMPPDLDRMLERCPAALLIGDAALRARRDGLQVIDLAAAWREMTGKPFVFALWAARDERDATATEPILEEALRLGLDALPGLDLDGTRTAGLSRRDLLSYLSRNIHFRLDREEIRSLEIFQTLCREEGILPAPPLRGIAASR